MGNKIFSFRDYTLEGASFYPGDVNHDYPTFTRYCDFCKEPLLEFSKHISAELECKFITKGVIEWREKSTAGQNVNLGACNSCGFWMLWSEKSLNSIDGSSTYILTSAARGVLKSFDISKSDTEDIGELRRFLIRNYGKRFNVHPKNMEKIVASVYRNKGFDLIETAYSNDGGVDIYLLDNGKKTTCIQVKRTKNKISPEQIRAFAGAVNINKCKKGIYVTTSSYTRGSKSTAKKYKTTGIELDLIDADRLFEELKIVTRSRYSSPDDVNAPYFPLWGNTGLIPNLGEMMYTNGVAFKLCRRGFDQIIPEIVIHDLVKKTTARSKMLDQKLHDMQLFGCEYESIKPTQTIKEIIDNSFQNIFGLTNFWSRNKKLILSALYAISSNQNKDIIDNISSVLEGGSLNNKKDRRLLSILYRNKVQIEKIKKSDIGYRTIKLLEEKRLINQVIFQFLREDKSCSLQLLKVKEEMTEMEIKYRKYRLNSEPELYFENKGYYVARNWSIGNIDRFIRNITKKIPDLSYEIH